MKIYNVKKAESSFKYYKKKKYVTNMPQLTLARIRSNFITNRKKDVDIISDFKQ